MSQIPARRKESSERRRSAILASARTVFARQGYTGTVVDDIAAQAGVAKGTVYLYFESKEAIFLAALIEGCRNLQLETREALAGLTTWQEKLKAFLEVRMRHLEEHQDFLRIYLTEFRNLCMFGRPVDAEFHHVMMQDEAMLAQVFAAAVATGQARNVDPELAAQTVIDLARGLMERRLRSWGRPLGPNDQQFCLDVLCKAFEPVHASETEEARNGIKVVQ